MIIKALLLTPMSAKLILLISNINAQSSEVIFMFTFARAFKKDTPVATDNVLANDRKLHTHNKALYSSSSWQSE